MLARLNCALSIARGVPRAAANPLRPRPAAAPARRGAGAAPRDGPPLSALQPSLPYADCRPEAEGGWTGGEADRLLTVNCPKALLARLPEGKRAAALGVLANDPRPHYQSDPERVYGMAFAGYELRFRVEGETLTVTDIRPSSGKESL